MPSSKSWTHGWIDISVPVAEQGVVWAGRRLGQLDRQSDLDRGDHDGEWSMGIHTGTHIDAPGHVMPGARTIDQLDLEVFVGPCWVADFRGCPGVGAGELAAAGIPEDTERLLLRTDNEVGLAFDGAQWLLELGVRLLGVDYLPIQPCCDASEIHRTLLRGGVPVIEGLRLSEVDPGPYVLVCLPMKLVGSEGAPARALLFPPSEPGEMLQ